MITDSPRISRAEAETLCILHVVGQRGCPAAELAGRLGLSPTLSAAVSGAAEPLVTSGLLLRSDADVLSLTEAGAERLARALDGLA